jgi:hypothetical protein
LALLNAKYVTISVSTRKIRPALSAGMPAFSAAPRGMSEKGVRAMV